METKCRELLVHQGSTVSGAAVALCALISRLNGLIEELVTSYSISDQELDVSSFTFTFNPFTNNFIYKQLLFTFTGNNFFLFTYGISGCYLS